jgi:hypothetical protein
MEYASDAAVAFAYIEVVWAPVDGAQAVLVCVFENERHLFGICMGGSIVSLRVEVE